MNQDRRKYLKLAALSGLSYFLEPFDFIGKKILRDPVAVSPALIAQPEVIEKEFIQLFTHPHAMPLAVDAASSTVLLSTLGEGGALYLNASSGTIKKVYNMDALCVGGAQPKYNDYYSHNYFYETEKETYLKLKERGSKYIPRDIFFNDDEQSITMSKQGDDLLINLVRSDWKLKEKHIAQIVEMAHEYREIGIFKRNICGSNLIVDRENDRLVAVDFKYVKPRTADYLPQEIQHQYMSLRKVDSSLPKRLESTFSDFPTERIRQYAQACRQIYFLNNPPDENDHEQRRLILERIKSSV